ncbi:D-alanyl-D-alanine carboxypeptidase [Streptomyces sp. NPDC016172]|uniref:D-alanyl-D-alanine carboxypeptidase n=1 Tax=Streptomyces sp. NPDC016172 TaxID=3364964 RepID=UPI0037027BDE
MAGESPDRSKQRESSARKTSGSASPVPEARSEAADPRLAVAREPEKSSARGGADTATRVLSTRTAEDPRNAERAASDAGDADTEDDAERGESDSGAEGAAAEGEQGASGSSKGSEEPEESKTGGSSGAEGSDGRLRNAVAAWVASADGDKEPDAEKDAAGEGDEEAPEAERAEKAEKADADAQEAGKAAGAAETGTDAEDGQEAAGAASEGSEAGRDDADEPEADRSVSAAETKPDERADDEGPEPADPRADNDVEATDTDTDTDAAADAKADQPADDEDPEPADPRADNDVEATDTDTDAKTDQPADDEDPEPADPRADNDVEATDTDADAKADEPADDESTEPADPRVSDDTKTAPKATDADTDAEDEDAAAEGKTRTDGTAKDKPGTDGTSESDDDADDAPAEPPVDQPTAVFKVVRPPVDQPTTMLKLGGAAKDLPKTDLPKKDVPKKDVPEKDAERTSKFVALKPLDDPSARKPAAPAAAPASAPAAAPADATAPVPTVGPERTTQQPLPPRPPLDLLAELTNTPPPPETPLRTAARRVKIWTPLVLLLVVVFAVVQSVRPLPSPTLELTAKDSYTFEGGKVDIPWPAEGQAALDVQGIGTFGSSGEQKPVPIASVAKVMTAYVILRDHPLKSGADGPKILIDQAAQDQSDAGQESTVDVTKGDRITEREALESILIASANNVARLLARWDAGSEKAFVQKMNDAAEDLGMKNTTYTDPSGLNNTTVSTAVDQVKLAKAAMQQPVFREVATMMSYVDYKQKKHDNWNRLVGYNDVTGIKTGTTTSALGNLVFAARKDVNGETRRIIGAVVRQPAGGPDNTILGAALHEGDKLIRAAQGALESATILKKGDIVGYADDGLGGRTPVAVTEDVTAVGWAGLSVELTFAGNDLPHTAKAGTKVGTLTVGDGTTSAVKVPVALQKELVEPGFAAKLTRLG